VIRDREHVEAASIGLGCYLENAGHITEIRTVPLAKACAEKYASLGHRDWFSSPELSGRRQLTADRS
jgi:hypothetical protein